MSDRSGKHDATFVGAGVALLILAFAAHAFLSFQSYQADNAGARQRNAEYNASDAREQVEAECIRVTGAVTPECAEDAKEAAKRANRTNYDLKAQQDMAEWAYAGQWAAVVVGMITLVGVIYVALTLNEARNATKAANTAADAAVKANEGFAKASQKELTAYVISEAFEVTQHFIYIEGFRLRWSFRLRNSGQTPAFDLTNVAKCSWATEEEVESWDLSAKPTSSTVLGPGRSLDVKGEFRNAETKTEDRYSGVSVAVLAGYKKTIWIKGIATYRDIDGRLWRHEYRWRLHDVAAFSDGPDILSESETKTKRVDLYAHSTGNSLRMIEDSNEKK